MEREQHFENLCLRGYHTQEYRPVELTHPIICIRTDAWLGVGYYFWTEISFAKYWGKDSKTQKTGSYDIYTALIEESNICNTVFNEKGYFFFKSKIERAIKHFKDLDVKILDLQRINRYLVEQVWKKIGIKGISLLNILIHQIGKYGILASAIFFFSFPKSTAQTETSIVNSPSIALIL